MREALAIPASALGLSSGLRGWNANLVPITPGTISHDTGTGRSDSHTRLSRARTRARASPQGER